MSIARYRSRKYWENYIDSIIDSINEDKDTILDLLTYGNLSGGEIIMILSENRCPSYKIKTEKAAEKSPFGEKDDE